MTHRSVISGRPDGQSLATLIGMPAEAVTAAGQRTRQALLDAGVEVAEQHGLAGLSVNRVLTRRAWPRAPSTCTSTTALPSSMRSTRDSTLASRSRGEATTVCRSG